MPQGQFKRYWKSKSHVGVRFEDSIETMKAMNVGTMIEVGPGKH